MFYWAKEKQTCTHSSQCQSHSSHTHFHTSYFQRPKTMAASGAGIFLTFFLRSHYRERIVSPFLAFLVTFYGTRGTEWLSSSLIFEEKKLPFLYSNKGVRGDIWGGTEDAFILCKINRFWIKFIILNAWYYNLTF